MIVPMKKIHLIVQKKDVVTSLEKVRDLGLLHVEHQEKISVPQTSDLAAKVNMLTKAIDFLKEKPKEPEKGERPLEPEMVDKTNKLQKIDAISKAEEIVSLLEKIEQIKDDISKRRVEITEWETWGDFNPEDLKYLEEKGIFVSLCEARAKEIVAPPEGVILEDIKSAKGTRRFLAVACGQQDLPFTIVPPPSVGLKQLKARQEQDALEIARMDEELTAYAAFCDVLEQALVKYHNALRFEETVQGMKDYESLALLRGYCPADLCSPLQEKAKQEQWAMLVEDPREDDHVPTLLKNPKWVSIIKPVFDIINVLPGYKEFDVSFIFLLFFALFVGMLVGDAGYGLLVLFIFAGLHLKLKKAKKKVPLTNFILVYTLCGCTILWGILTGTFFGQQWIASTIKPAVPWLLVDKNVQILCFMIGTVHLSIAHLWNMIMKWPSLKAFADLGWMFILWGMYAVAKFLVLDMPMTSLSFIFLSVGAGLVMFFTKPHKNILKSIAPGLGDILLNGINSFTDVVSYIRLYAVGLATVAVADAANEMSLGWIIILHTVNLILAGLAILVHGIRLNILEFSSNHLNLEWSGFKFNPFRKAQKVSS